MNELISSVPWWAWIGTVIVVATLVFKVGSWKGKVDTTFDSHDEPFSGFRDEFKEVRAEIQKLTNAIYPSTSDSATRSRQFRRVALFN